MHHLPVQAQRNSLAFLQIVINHPCCSSRLFYLHVPQASKLLVHAHPHGSRTPHASSPLLGGAASADGDVLGVRWWGKLCYSRSALGRTAHATRTPALLVTTAQGRGDGGRRPRRCSNMRADPRRTPPSAATRDGSLVNAATAEVAAHACEGLRAAPPGRHRPSPCHYRRGRLNRARAQPDRTPARSNRALVGCGAQDYRRSHGGRLVKD
ncbi:unnamed protein product [Urochloa humidicola]